MPQDGPVEGGLTVGQEKWATNEEVKTGVIEVRFGKDFTQSAVYANGKPVLCDELEITLNVRVPEESYVTISNDDGLKGPSWSLTRKVDSVEQEFKATLVAPKKEVVDGAR